VEETGERGENHRPCRKQLPHFITQCCIEYTSPLTVMYMHVIYIYIYIYCFCLCDLSIRCWNCVVVVFSFCLFVCLFFVCLLFFSVCLFVFWDIRFLLFCGISVAQALVSCELFCRSLFVLLSFFFLSLHCQSYFDFQLLITSLISLNFSRNNSNYIFIVETQAPLVKESNYNSCKINKVYK